jgi:hypothetical protein
MKYRRKLLRFDLDCSIPFWYPSSSVGLSLTLWLQVEFHYFEAVSLFNGLSRVYMMRGDVRGQEAFMETKPRAWSSSSPVGSSRGHGSNVLYTHRSNKLFHFVPQETWFEKLTKADCVPRLNAPWASSGFKYERWLLLSNAISPYALEYARNHPVKCLKPHSSFRGL